MIDSVVEDNVVDDPDVVDDPVVDDPVVEDPVDPVDNGKLVGGAQQGRHSQVGSVTGMETGDSRWIGP